MRGGEYLAVETLERLWSSMEAACLADTAMDDADSKQTVRDEFGLDQKTPTNPRNIKTRTADIGRGMKSLTPIGTLTCQADREMPFKGVSSRGRGSSMNRPG
jgi:hypothetical protein